MEDNLSDNENMLQTQVDEETNVNDSDDNEAYNDISEGGWIQWFCQLDGNEFFVEIDEEFIRNRWNIYGINKLVKNYKYKFLLFE
jgi:casein kinase II subunit beta